jgi:hypothetical protein
MKKSIFSDIRNKRIGRPPVNAVPVLVRIPPAEMEPIDGWIKEQPKPKPSRPEAIRRLVELGLTVKTKSASSERQRAALADLASKAIDSLTVGTADSDEKASRMRRLIKGPEEFRELRVDRPGKK